MDVAEVDRRLREDLEERVGRPVSDEEWELFKRFQLEQAKTEGPTSTAAAVPAGSRVAAFVVGVLAALAGAGLLAGWDLMFSAGVRIPLGIFVMLVAVAGLGFLLRVFGWDLGTLFFGVIFFLVPFAIAGGALVFKDRQFLTSTDEASTVWSDTTPAELVGGGLLLAALVLFWTFSPKLVWFLGGLALLSFAGYWIAGSDRPLAITALWLLAGAIALLAAGAVEGGASARGAAGSLLFLVGLGFVVADLLVQGRPLAILLWVPLIALAVVGCGLGVVAVSREGSWRARLGRALFVLVAVAPALVVAAVLQVSPW